MDRSFSVLLLLCCFLACKTFAQGYTSGCDRDTDPTWCPKAARASINCPDNVGRCHEQIAELCPQSCEICKRPVCRDRISGGWCERAVENWRQRDARVPECQTVVMAQDCSRSCGWCSP